MTQSVWLFTRDQETVRLLVQPAPAGFRLTIVGPGAAAAEFEFAEMPNLNRFREDYEQRLLTRGFRLDAAAERRGGSDRRATPRPAAADRRR